MSSGSRTGTPQPWANGTAGQSTAAAGGGGGLQLPQQAKGKGAVRSTSQEPNGESGTSGRATNVNSLMDAVGASGVDLGAEEESLRASNERAHAQAMANAANPSGGQAAAAYAYNGIDRSRKQDFIDPSVLAECVKKVAAAFQLKTLEPDTIPLIALATRQRLQSLINESISARNHRQTSSHFKPPPFIDPSSSSAYRASKKRRRRKAVRRDPMTGDEIMEEGEEEDEDDEMNSSEEEEDETGSVKRPKVPAWDALVYDDPERYLTVLERVDRAEEAKHRRERMTRDAKEQREKDIAEEMYAAELARKAMEEDQDNKMNSAGEAGSSTTTTGEKGKGKVKNAADRFLASNQPDGGAPSTPTKELGKDGKPKKKKKPKTGDTPGGSGGGGGTNSTPGPTTSGTSTPSATSIAKNMSEDVRKRLTDSSAMKSLGGTKYSWMNAGGIGSPSPAMGSSSGVSSLLGKPKFAPASSIGGSSSRNPANNPPISANSSSLELANALTTSRLNVPQLHDSQRTQVAKDTWEAGHHVVELGDLLFAMDRERGAGVGKGAGRNAALRGRAGITRGGYRGVGTGR
ncbi:uncharacterized protein JCM6883_002112 [Sporobolomyces salmoneus]|uniref:uncharacterized protein n=1 Tax=Sporobolomyces salmoneus TaxID=183962 RepID=UPI00317B41DD